MPILDTGQLVASAVPIATQAIKLIWSIIQLLLFIGFLVFIWYVTTFNVRLLERKYTKGGRVIVTLRKAKKIFDKRLGHPQIQPLGFKAKKLNEPPADCIFPFHSMFGNTIMYDFVVKDGIHYPVSNAVMGRKYIVDTQTHSLQQDDKFMEWAAVNGISVSAFGNPETVVYSIEGSGLEITRDYEAEQATLNNLISAAEKYRNRKPIEIAAMYGLMIVICVGAFVTLIYAFYKSGQIIEAVNRGWDIFNRLGEKVVEQKLGPG